MAHYRYKHHRKTFWNFLSELIGEDSKMAKVKDDIAMSPYYNYYLYLTKISNFAVSLDGCSTAHRLSADMRFKLTRDS